MSFRYPEHLINPTEELLKDPEFTHPELANEAVFSGTLHYNDKNQLVHNVEPEDDDLPLRSFDQDVNNQYYHKKADNSHVGVSEPETETTWHGKKVNNGHHRRHHNEVYPKDAPYTQGASSQTQMTLCSLAVSLLVAKAVADLIAF